MAGLCGTAASSGATRLGSRRTGSSTCAKRPQRPSSASSLRQEHPDLLLWDRPSWVSAALRDTLGLNGCEGSSRCARFVQEGRTFGDDAAGARRCGARPSPPVVLASSGLPYTCLRVLPVEIVRACNFLNGN